MELFQLQDCTAKCQSQEHAAQLIAAITKGSLPQIKTYFQCICKNFSHTVDEFGRTVLHMAASCGKWQLVKWLLEEIHVDFDRKDLESGYTPLHRSLYYGHISAAQMLLKHGVNTKVYDSEGLTALDIIMKDNLAYLSKVNGPCEVYTWGENINYNLGHNVQQSRKYPEVVDFFRKKNCSIKEVLLGKFHSVFLSQNGQVYTCGHGQGGRLGHSDDSAILIPKQVGLGFTCLQIAIGVDHTVLLAENNTVWTCGLNSFYQLGHSPPPEKFTSPKTIVAKVLKNVVIKGICASNYHTVIYTSNKLFTCGMNAGQIGQPKDIKFQISPSEVSALNFKDFTINHVTTSLGAIACSTIKGDVFILHEYQCHKVASKLLNIHQIVVYGGYLDSNSFDAKAKKESCEPVVIILIGSGKLFSWHGDSRILRRCLFSMPRQLHCVNVILNKKGLLFITKDGEGFTGQIVLPKYQQSICGKNHNKEKDCRISTSDPHMVEMLNKEDCVMIKIERIPYIHRGIMVSSDPESRNFAITQNHPSSNLTDIPITLPSDFIQNFAALLDETDINDFIHDIIIKVGKKEFPAHKFILASRSDFFNKLFSKTGEPNISVVNVNDIHPEIFSQLLIFIYTNNCEMLSSGNSFVLPIEKEDKNRNTIHDEQEVSNHKKSNQQKHNQKEKNVKDNKKDYNSSYSPLKMLHAAAKKLGVQDLMLLFNNSNVFDRELMYYKINNELPKLQFIRKKMYHLCDTSILSSDGKEFDCHKCVLAARMDYFYSMFSSGWIETSACNALSVPASSTVLSCILEYLYSDNIDLFANSLDVEFLCSALIVSDQLLISHLHSVCETTLASLITLKNVVSLTELSVTYNAAQLKSTCIQFICLNLASLLEMRVLDNVSDGVLEELTTIYRKMIPAMSWRIITPFSSGPSLDELQYKLEKYSDDIKKIQFANIAEDVSKKTKTKRKSMNRRISSGEDQDKNSNKDENSQEERQRHESFCSVGSGITDVDSDIFLDQTFIQEESEVSFDGVLKQNFVSISPPDNVGPLVSPGSSKGNDSLPWGKQLKIERSPPPITDFRKLMEFENIEAKQLKQANKFVKSPVLESPGKDNIKENKKSPPWKLGEKIVLNFRDLLKKQEEKHNNHQTKPRSDSLAYKTSPQLSDSSSPLQNPWTKLDTSPTSPVCSFSQIVKEEIKYKVTETKLTSKPLTLIQLEEKAMQELLSHYRAVDNPEEYITVERMQALVGTSSPIWKITQTVDTTLGYKTLISLSNI